MLLSLQHIRIEFGARCIVDDANWQVSPGEKIGLIGRNGAGKSTLLKVIAGELAPQAGTIQRQQSCKIGFFHQELLSFQSSASMREVAMDAFREVTRCWHRMHELSELMSHQPNNEALLQEYSEMLHRFETANGYQLKAMTEEVLEGLGFQTSDLDRPYSSFSGGWRMRVLLARLLLQQPDLLLLDEPTNHLDLSSMQWLENYLQQSSAACIIASHDRYFLDRLVHKIVEIDQQRLSFYNGNYHFYTTQKQLRLEQQQRDYENQQAYIKQQQAFVERFRAKASKAAQVQSVVKKLEKLDRIEPVQTSTTTPRFHFHPQRQPGKLIMSGENISKTYGQLSILKETSFEILRGDRIALIGANGKGKSTLLRILCGKESYTGKIKLGHQVIIAYYAQHQTEELHLDHTILQEMEGHAPAYTTQEIRNILGQFMFSGEDVLKPIQVLSGGEKARVALAKMLLTGANFLLIDEPTNHLDIPSMDALKQALLDFPGSFILVSHDRYFLEGLVNKIWYIEDGQIKEWPKDIASWIREKAHSQASAESNNKKVENKPAEAKRAQRKAYQQQKRQFEKLEKQLNQLQDTLRTLEQQLADPTLYADQQAFLRVEQQYRSYQTQYQQLHMAYEQAFEQLLEMEQLLASES
ncbi:MAG: ABC-F family ATP-binding cassette domain-containing protein [Thermoflavifilum sp.]|nr:ABC-F family ATP-binding cassette domain-containing protein [Thermoflavifilum sp.]